MNTGRHLVVRLFNYLMTVIFIFGAVLQYNDPDPVRWMLIYGAAAATCIWWHMGREGVRMACVVIAIIAIAWAIVLFAGIGGDRPFYMRELLSSFGMKNESVEIYREIGGLLIIAFWMIVLSFYSYGKSRAGGKVMANT